MRKTLSLIPDDSRICLSLALVLCCVAAWTSCSTFYRGVIGLTTAMDSASTEYARIYNDGLIPPDVHERASRAHAQYQQLAGVAHDALTAYKLTGDKTKFLEAFLAAQQAAIAFANLVAPHMGREKAQTITATIQNATTL